MEIVWRFWADWQITVLTLFVQIRPTDGISFMGKDWDKALPDKIIWKECLRVLKPGAFAFVMASPRQDVLARMTVQLEEAGFNTNFTSLYWTYATGFPKAHDISKGIDKKLGAERLEIAPHPLSERGFFDKVDENGKRYHQSEQGYKIYEYGGITLPATELARQFEGSYGGFQPKPAVEVIIVAMKPKYEKTYVGQALKNGKGITWLDDCRIPPVSCADEARRFPANLLVSDDILGDFSRFFALDSWAEKNLPFLIVPKASKQEKSRGATNHHPTVKPIKLMAYLITMGSREGDLVLDPFLGSGSTCVAAKMLGRSAIGIELSREYCKIATERVKATQQQVKGEQNTMKDFKLMNIAEIKIGERYRKDLGDIDKLAASIADQGLLHAPVVSSEGELIAGERRIEACKKLGLTEIPVKVVDLKGPSGMLKAQRDENAVRKDFLPSEAVAIAHAIEAEEKKAAAQRSEEGRRRGGLVRQGKTTVVEICHQPEHAKTRDKVAACVGMSGRTLEKAKKVVEAAEQDPQKYGKLVEEMDSKGKVDGYYRKLRRMKQMQDIEKEPLIVSEGHSFVIVCDPWNSDNEAQDQSQGDSSISLNLKELKAFSLNEIAHKDVILWLWTTNGHLPETLELLKAWGFEYKTMLTWVKQRMSAGDWARGQTEHCLLGIRGNPSMDPLTKQATVLHSPVRKNSEKPEEFYELVESLSPGSIVCSLARKPNGALYLFGAEVGEEAT